MIECLPGRAHDDYPSSAGALQKYRQLIVDLLGEEIRHESSVGAKRPPTAGPEDPLLDSVLDSTGLCSGTARGGNVSAIKLGWAWGLGRPYERLWSFFASYVVVLSGSTQPSLLVDQYSLWRTARAIALALFLISVQTFVLFLRSWLIASPTAHLIGLYFLIWIASSAGTWLSMYIVLGTYSRLCFTLFSLVYVTYDKQAAAH